MPNLSDIIGTQVTWVSSNTQKSGEILALIPANTPITSNVIFNQLGIRWQGTKISQLSSQNERYLIIVRRVAQNNQPLKPHYYAASAAVINNVLEEAAYATVQLSERQSANN
jgi:hypothetical protein